MKNNTKETILKEFKNVDTVISIDKESIVIPLFYSNEEPVLYSLVTDGDCELIDTWIDKFPGNRDSKLKGFKGLYRHDFKNENASVIMVEKKINMDITKSFYVNDRCFGFANIFLSKEKFYQISFNEKGKYLIKGREKINIES